MEGVGKVTDEAECRAQPSGCAANSVRLWKNPIPGDMHKQQEKKLFALNDFKTNNFFVYGE